MKCQIVNDGFCSKMEVAMRKEFEIQGCIEVPSEVTEDEFWDAFIGFIEAKG